jgi:hypothetical protein
MSTQVIQRYVDTQGAAQHTGLSESFLEKERVSGRGPLFIKAGKAVRYDVRDLDAWLAECKLRSTSEYAA